MKNVIKGIILENQRADLPDVISRDLQIPLHLGVIVSLIGARRSGKTYMLYDCMKKLQREGISREKMLFMNFEDERLNIHTEDLDLILQAYSELYPDISLGEVFFFFDEIQNVPGWEKFVRRVFDTKSRGIFVSGSNSRLLSTEIATSLRGRSISFSVYPLSLREYLRFHQVPSNIDIQKTRSAVIHYTGKFLREGGFPELVFFDETNRRRIIQQYFNVMMLRDLVERYSISNIGALRFFVKKIFAGVGKPFSVHKAFNDLKSLGYKVSNKYLYEFFSQSNDIFLCQTINRYHPSEIKQEKSDKKAYIIDNGMLSAIEFSVSKNEGKLFENMVALEFLKAGKEIMYFKQTYECDFVVKDNLTLSPVQVCFDLHDGETRQREIRGLVECCHALDVTRGTIITFDQEESFEQNGVQVDVVAVWRWFL
ncbi:MAG: ATP-binding protein [Bacteroidetes bacterium]|nr:ATP-binding protein [Bacteroidota bacterium]